MNDSENQKKSEKIVSFMNTSVMLLIVTAVVYLLFFAFNYGYNSYFGLPVYFSTMLPLRMISETPTLFLALILFCSFVVFVIPFRKWIKRVLFDTKTIIVLLLSILIADFFWLHDIWTIISIFCMLLFFLALFLLNKKESNDIEQKFNVNELERELNIINELEREINIRESLNKEGFIVLDDWVYKTVDLSSKMRNCIKQKYSEVQHYSNKLDIDDIISDVALKISQFILFIHILFAVVALMGRYNAMKEDSFLFIDEQTVVIDIYESNYASILVDYDKGENKYIQTGTYVLIPIDNPELKLYKKDGITIK